MKQEKDNDRMKQDVNETSRTMKPGKTVKPSSDTSQTGDVKASSGKTPKPDKKH